jgi:hypothetical protein
MGIKPAGSFFQQTMQMIVHAPNFTQYCLANLRKVFQAARDRKLTCNPKKSKFLEPEVTALGLTLSAEGIRMSDDKIRKALDFPVPVQVHH